MFFSKKEINLTNKTEKELLIMQTQAMLESEKNIARIKDNVVFYFYLGLVMIIVAVFKSV